MSEELTMVAVSAVKSQGATLHQVDLTSLAVIDLAVVAQYISPDPIVYQPLLLEFLSSIEEYALCMRDAFNKQDWPVFAANAHKLNGSAGYYGAQQLLALCSQLQYLTAGIDTQQVAPLFEQLQQAFDNLENYQVKNDDDDY